MPTVPKRLPKSLKGRFLLDGGTLSGTYFHRTVVLVCEHNPEGAFGLVLNRPAGNLLEDVLPNELPPFLRVLRLFNGGPVQGSALSYLSSHPKLTGGSVLPRISLGHDLDELIALGKAPPEGLRLKTFAGYAGWAPGQLDDEIRRDSWIVLKATADLIFAEPADDLWRRVLGTSADWKQRLLGGAPDAFWLN